VHVLWHRWQTFCWIIHVLPFLSRRGLCFLQPTKSHPDVNVNRGKLSEYAKATLGSGNMRSAVVLPKGEELNEWLAGEPKILH
jgi:hypothetical protein